MNVSIDRGHTYIKVGFFDHYTLRKHYVFGSEDFFFRSLAHQPFEHAIIYNFPISEEDLATRLSIKGKVWHASMDMSLPIAIQYRTPHTLGMDRVAAVCAIAHIMPRQNCLIVDMGTCINIELIDANNVYRGGSISPGVQMRFDAMHRFTKKLPLVQAKKWTKHMGDDTITCMLGGVMSGIKFEIEGVIEKYEEEYPNISVILCGGDVAHVDIKQAVRMPHLVLEGLNRILLYNLNHVDR